MNKEHEPIGSESGQQMDVVNQGMDGAQVEMKTNSEKAAWDEARVDLAYASLAAHLDALWPGSFPAPICPVPIRPAQIQGTLFHPFFLVSPERL